MPVYNVQYYLRECLDSIVNQTLTNIEIICIDDGSTDASGKILDEYAAKDKRFKIIHKENGGYGKAMNVGLDNAHGEYIGIVESDDFIRPEMYEEQYQIAKDNNLDMLKADFQAFIGEGESRQFTYRKMSNNKEIYNKVVCPLLDLKLFNTNNVIWSGLYSRKFLAENGIRFNETPGASYQDNGFYFQTYCLAKRMMFLDKDYYRLRRDNPNSSIKNKAKVYCICDEYDFISRFLNNHPEFPQEIWSMYWLKRYHNCLWTFDRIAAEFKLEFLEKFANDFREVYTTGGLHSPIWSQADLNNVNDLVRNYKEYYENCKQKWRGKYAKDLVKWYENVTHKKLNLDNPQTFNEKIQWMKLYDSTPIKTRLADKYLVRDWVKEKIGEEYLVPLLGVYDRFEDIDFDKLPNKFVIKCNHGSGFNIIVKDKTQLDMVEVKSKLAKWMVENFAFHAGCELHYKNIQPKIIIEEYMENNSGDLYDYKFWCFDGKVEYIQFLSERNLGGLKMAFYDREWNKQNFVYSHPLDSKDMPRPENLDKMISLAEKLSKGFNHVRVDFYKLDDGRIVFGEMTFTSASGICKWNHEQINQFFGRKITLPERAYDVDTGEYYVLPRNYHQKLMECTAPEKPKEQINKAVLSYKLFNFIPVFTYKQRGGNRVWKVMGLPVWRVRRFASDVKRKYYAFGVPLISIHKN